MKKIAVYGSLKKGFFNHYRLEREDALPLGKVVLRGFTLHSLGYYPAVVPGEEKDLVAAELYGVSEEVFESLKRMEEGAGYKTMTHPDDFFFWAFPESYGYPQVAPDASGVATWREK